MSQPHVLFLWVTLLVSPKLRQQDSCSNWAVPAVCRYNSGCGAACPSEMAGLTCSSPGPSEMAGLTCSSAGPSEMAGLTCSSAVRAAASAGAASAPVSGRPALAGLGARLARCSRAAVLCAPGRLTGAPSALSRVLSRLPTWPLYRGGPRWAEGAAREQPSATHAAAAAAAAQIDPQRRGGRRPPRRSRPPLVKFRDTAHRTARVWWPSCCCCSVCCSGPVEAR